MAFPKKAAFMLIDLLLLGFLGGICFGAPAAPADPAQDRSSPIQSVRVEKIASAKVGETREFWVSLPDGYAESGEKYPVLYMMDADFNFNSGVIGGIRYAALLGRDARVHHRGHQEHRSLEGHLPRGSHLSRRQQGRGPGRPIPGFHPRRADPAHRQEPIGPKISGSSTARPTPASRPSMPCFAIPTLADAYIAASATLSIPSFRAKRDEWIRGLQGRQAPAGRGHGRERPAHGLEPERGAEGSDRYPGASRFDRPIPGHRKRRACSGRCPAGKG